MSPDELSSEPWFYVDENDVFPEEFRNFLGLSEPLREVFMEHHADLFDVEYWRRAQQAINAGELRAASICPRPIDWMPPRKTSDRYAP